MSFIKKYKDYIILFFIGALLFIPFLGRVHLFDWDEINFAESAREMLITKEFFRVQINFKPFWEKPPLFIWLQALSMSIFGINEFAARLPNAIVGMGTLLILFSIGKKYFSSSFGWWWVLAYIGSFLPHLYFKSGIIDPLFNLFIFLGIFYLAKTSILIAGDRNRITNIAFAGLFIGLGVLTKGPVALLVAILCSLVYCILQKTIKIFSLKELAIFCIPLFLVAFTWFGVETILHGPWFLQEFIVYQIRLFKTQDAGHGGPFIYHFIVLYIGCFPASIFIFNSFRKNNLENPIQKAIKLWLIISFFVVLILFSIVKTKIVHYSSFCYFPLTFLSAYGISKIQTSAISFPKFIKVQLAILGLLIGLVLFIFPLILKNISQLLLKYGYLIKDKFALANLQAQVYWSGMESLIGLFYVIIILAILFTKSTFGKKIKVLFISTALVIGSTLVVIVPNIERYSQGAAIEFFQSLKDKDVYVDVFGFKSYGHLFYTQKKPINDTLSINEEYYLNGKIDKDVYLVSKITNTRLDELSKFKKINEKNGFVFYRREK